MIAAAPSLADRAVAFISGLTLTDDFRGQPFELRPWQEDIVRRFYEEAVPGLRRYNECGIWLPRKNGKTQVAAAIAAFELFCNPAQGEIYCAAAARDQATIVFQKIVSMIRANPLLESRVKIVDSQKRILHRKTGTLLRAVASNAGILHGLNPSLVIADEIHAWRNRDLWTALTTGSDTRTNRMFLTITTAGTYSNTSFEWEQYEYACKVRDGVLENDRYLPIVFAADREEDWNDEAVWRRVNPSLADFRSLEAMREAHKKARDVATLENQFRQLYLNQHTAQRIRWLSMEQWNRGRAEFTPEPGESCVVGLDLSTRQDVTAAVFLFRRDDGLYAVPKFWVPEETAAEKQHKDRVPYLTWIKQGYVRSTPGNAVYYGQVADDLAEFSQQFHVLEVAVDPWNAGGIEQLLQERGFTVIELNQSYRNLNEACRELETLLKDGKFFHPGNPCLDWMASNAEVEETHGGHIRPIKQSKTNRIDGISALTIALARRLLTDKQPSVYENRGFTLI